MWAGGDFFFRFLLQFLLSNFVSILLSNFAFKFYSRFCFRFLISIFDIFLVFFFSFFFLASVQAVWLEILFPPTVRLATSEPLAHSLSCTSTRYVAQWNGCDTASISFVDDVTWMATGESVAEVRTKLEQAAGRAVRWGRHNEMAFETEAWPGAAFPGRCATWPWTRTTVVDRQFMRDRRAIMSVDGQDSEAQDVTTGLPRDRQFRRPFSPSISPRSMSR